MQLSEILSLLAVQFNNSFVKELSELMTEEECNSRLLSKSTLAGFKRLCPKVGSSPRLSKILLSLGIPEKAVSLALSTPTIDILPRVSAELRDLLEMGDSTHFISCQASNHSMRKVEQLIPYLGEHLFLWVLGERQSESGDGFKARAILRVMYSDKDYAQPAGLYIDRPYGQSGTLLFYVSHLKEWWDNWCAQKGFSTSPILMPPVWQRDNGGGNDFQYLHGGLYSEFLYCPSAEAGYKDTLTHLSGPYDCFSALNLEVRNLHLKAYHERPWEWGVYLCSLREHLYNAQKCAFLTPPREREPRGILTSDEREQIQTLIAHFGHPTSGSFKRVTYVYEGIALSFGSQEIALIREMLYYPSLEEEGKYIELFDLSSKKVEHDLPELGLWRAVSLKDKFNLPGAAWWGNSVEVEGKSFFFTNLGRGSIQLYTSGGELFLDISRNSIKVVTDQPSLGYLKPEKIKNIRLDEPDTDDDTDED
jgi:hypothetical protein